MTKDLQDQDLSFLQGYHQALNDTVLKLMAKSQRVEQIIKRRSGEDEPRKK